MASRRRVTRGRGRKQRGGAMLRRKPRLVDKIAEGVSMFLSGPSPTFATIGAKVLRQAAKVIADSVKHYRKRKQKGGKFKLIRKLFLHHFSSC